MTNPNVTPNTNIPTNQNADDSTRVTAFQQPAQSPTVPMFTAASDTGTNGYVNSNTTSDSNAPYTNYQDWGTPGVQPQTGASAYSIATMPSAANATTGGFSSKAIAIIAGISLACGLIGGLGGGLAYGAIAGNAGSGTDTSMQMQAPGDMTGMPGGSSDSQSGSDAQGGTPPSMPGQSSEGSGSEGSSSGSNGDSSNGSTDSSSDTGTYADSTGTITA